METVNKHLKLSAQVRSALENGVPVVALESTIVAHGMPYPENVSFASRAEEIVLNKGAVPATIAIIEGSIHVGLTEAELNYITDSSNKIEKAAIRDVGHIVACGLSGATTVSATMHIAHLAGIKVFTTGGIGGVHRNAERTFDISQDLVALSQIPMIVVSAGAKATLDIPKTLEQLEALAVPVLGYKTDDFPAFYSRVSTGCKLNTRCDSAKEIVDTYITQQVLKIKSALLVANPVPVESEIPHKTIKGFIDTAIHECAEKKIEGKAVTPFILKRIVELSGGKSLETNIALALNNVRLAAEIAALIK